MVAEGKGKWASMYDIRKFFSFFDPLPPCQCHKSADFVPFVCFWGTPLPPPIADVIYGSPLTISFISVLWPQCPTHYNIVKQFKAVLSHHIDFPFGTNRGSEPGIMGDVFCLFMPTHARAFTSCPLSIRHIIIPPARMGLRSKKFFCKVGWGMSREGAGRNRPRPWPTKTTEMPRCNFSPMCDIIHSQYKVQGTAP